MKKKIFFLSLIVLFLGLNFNFALADPGSSTPITFPNPLGNNVENISDLLNVVMEHLEGIIVTIAIIMIVIGGIMYMMSFGNDRAMERAKNVIMAAVIGLAIALSARTFLQTIWDVLGVGSSVASPGGESADSILGNILEFVLSLVGVIAIISLVIGGFLYMTSYGDEYQAERGKKVIIASIIGIVVCVGAVVLVRGVGGLLGYSIS